LKVIALLQDNSTDKQYLNGKPFLSPNFNYHCYNTRVIQLYTTAGRLFTSYLDIDNRISLIQHYRVMHIDDTCCVLQLLQYDSLNDTYLSTKQYITIHVDAIGAIRCIKDIFIHNL